MEDKDWLGLDRCHPRYFEGIDSFIKFVKKNTVEVLHVCPCRQCKMYKGRIYALQEMEKHLLLFGMMAEYTNWTSHGEPPYETSVYALRQEYIKHRNIASSSTSRIELNPTMQLLDDAFPFRVRRDTMEEEDAYDNGDAKEAYEKYEKLLSKAQTPVFQNSKKSLLETLLKLMKLKVEGQWSDNSFDKLLKFLTQELLPEENNYPDSYGEVKKLLKNMGMSYEVIHACEFGCVLYYKEYKDLEYCPLCSEPRYVADTRTPSRVVRYFPLAPRLKRLYMSPEISKEMRWHAERVQNDDDIRHPSDGEAWKKFDRDFPDFACEVRNVRLGLATDGFCPYGISGVSYSTWPIVVVPYNLPPSLCMKKEFNIMCMLISGPKSPSKCLSVFLRPLVDELNMLWDTG